MIDKIIINATVKNNYFNELEPSAIPYMEIINAVNSMEYGSIERLQFSIMFAIGCRPSELDNLRYSGKTCFLKGNWIYFRPGKNQIGWRKEFLSDNLLKELAFYRSNNRVFSDFFFGAKEISVRAYFNKKIRPKLNSCWQERQLETTHWCKGFKYQLKGLRKSFVTLLFYQELQNWKSAEIAIDLVSKRLKHSRTNITINHYIREFSHLDLDKFGSMQPHEILNLASQKHLCEYDLFNQDNFLENSQLRLQDF